MGLYDDILEEQPIKAAPQKNATIQGSGLFDDLLVEEPQTQPTFSEAHPILASTPEALKQFGTRAVKSYPEFAKGLNDLVALAGDKTGLQGVSDFGRSNAQFWQEQSDKIQIDPKYQGVKGLQSKETVLPTIMGSLGDQASNLLMAGGGGAAGAKAAVGLGLKGAAKTGLITAGTAVPNLAQEGQYLDKIEAFKNVYGRIPTAEELRQIQNTAIVEKATNTALETVSDKLLFGKMFPQGAITKDVKGIIKNAGQQALTEAATEGMQESVSIGAEKALGINQGNNLERLADSMAIGGITGGVMGGVTSAAAQPYNTQFPENQNVVNPTETLKNVSAQILDNGKVLYNSAADNILKAANELNNLANTPDTFDTLRALSKDGAFSNKTLEEIAPKTAKKLKEQQAINNSIDSAVEDTNVPNMIEGGNLYKATENGETNIVNESEVENIANRVKSEQVGEETTAVLEKPKTRKEKKAAAKAAAIAKIKEIAPNTAKQMETSSNFVKDDDGVYEKVGENQLRNVDTNEVFTPANPGQYSEWKHDPSELMEVKEFKYDAKSKNNADNYANSKQDVIDSYNNYIKNPTEANAEIYQEAYGKATEEYRQKEETFKKNDKLTQIAPKTVKKMQDSNIRVGLNENGDLQHYDISKKNPDGSFVKVGEPIYNESTHIDHTAQANDMVKSAEKIKKNSTIQTYKGVDSIVETDNYYINDNYIVRKDKFILKGKGEAKRAGDRHNSEVETTYGFFESYTYNPATITDDVITLPNAQKPIAARIEYIDSEGNSKDVLINLDYIDNQFRGYEFSVSNETRNGSPIIKISDNGETIGFTAPFVTYGGAEKQGTTSSLKEHREKTEKEKVEKREANKKPDIKYDNVIYIKDKEGNIKYHSDGNALYKNDSATYGYKTETTTNPKLETIEEWINELETFSTKLKETGLKLNIKKTKTTAIQFKAGKDKDGKDINIYINKKYLLDGKGIELFVGDTDVQHQKIAIKRNGELIGLVMPIAVNENEAQFAENSEKYNKMYLTKSKNISEKLKEIAPKTMAKKESEVKNEHLEQNTERRQSVSNENEKAETGTRGTEEEQSGTSEILRGNGQQELRQSELSSRTGISKKDLEIINKPYKNQHELNKAIEEYINNGEYKKYPGAARVPQDVKDWLKKYTGAGGLEKQGAEGKGLLSEYYTPQNVVYKMWELTEQYVNTDGAKVLEPSVGIGRFLENAPANTSFDVFEMNPVTARITKILYPNANVETGEFQKKFIDPSKNLPVKSVNPEYDIVIGNPPYGKYNSKFKGMGEGAKYEQLESYFINRGLDTLKENGILTYIVPSSFLRGQKGKLEIANKCELLDAYRLPNGTFGTTDIGTDIIVLRKRTGKTEARLFSDSWFKIHPEKILGEVQKGKGNWGTDLVKGDKNAVNSIQVGEKDIKETVATDTNVSSKNSAAKKSDHIVDTNKKVKKAETVKGNVEYTEYKHENRATEREMELWEHTNVSGSLDGNYEPGEDINKYNGKLYNDFNYLQGNIYEKLEKLKYENISEEQRERQRNKLLSVLPKEKEAKEIRFNPTSDFIQDFDIENAEEVRWGRKQSPLIKGFIDYVDAIPTVDWRDDFRPGNIRAYLNGEKIDFRIPFKSGTPEHTREKSKKLAKLKDIVEKHFSNYVDKVLEKETKDRLVKEWNKTFNCIYNPDYTKMPLLVRGLNSKFKGRDLKLKETQIEGINFLANNGVGLIGFEVGVGKTLTGIISTVQNMQMGRCKRPLIIIPKNIKKNWKEEFAETFPNIKVVDVDNMSKWDGVVEDGTVTLATYQALDNLWYNKSDVELTNMIYELGNNFDKETTKRGKESVKERFENMVGKALKGNKAKFKVEDLGFDHVTFDEAHAGKNLFDEARADSMEKDAGGKAKGTNTYFNMRGGSQSKVALRMFLLTQHILNENNNRNVFMLTATPFNNQSLEVFNMLSYLAKDKLDKMGLYNVYQFNEQFIDVTSDIVLDANNNPIEKQVELGFKNVGALREIIKSCMLIRTADDAKVIRPNKTVTRQKLDPTEEQLYWFDQADEIAMDREIEGALFKSISMRRNATISPDVAANNFDVSPEDFIKNSPKLNYIMRCVESMKNKDAKTSQIMYMPIGVKFLGKIKQYLVDKGVYKPEEIEIISSENALSNPEKEEARISKITDSFNDREGDVKLIIGTQKIQVGMNLNKNTSTLYMPYVEWNPTDFVQTVGRMWRQGNSYKNVRVVVPLLKNSSDSFMFQKLDEKIKRMNDLMGSDKEYISNDDLQTQEEKIAMISNPAKRAKMYTLLEKDKIEFEIKKLEARNKKVQSYKSDLTRKENDIKYYNEEIEKLEKLQEENGELPPYQRERLRDMKRSLIHLKRGVASIHAQIELDNIDFDGKDSEESINALIEEQKKELDKLNDLEKAKTEEYSVEYEKERRNIKSIDEHIQEFEKEYDELYTSEIGKSEDSLSFEKDTRKSYEKTGEEAFSTPAIELETQSKREKKSKIKKRIEKAKEIVDARKYNKALKEGVQKWHAEIAIRRYEVDRTLNSFINVTKGIAKELNVNPKNLREVMPFLRERTDLPEKLNRPELKKVWDIIHSTKGMAERLTKLADDTSNKFEKFWNEYQAVQAGGDFKGDENKIKNYINHEWDMGDKQTNSLLTNYFSVSSKHGKQRTIETYYDGINGIKLENGEVKTFKPKTLDYAELLKMQTDSLITATIDKAFADSVKNMKTSEGANLILPASQAPSNWVQFDHRALNKTIARPVSTKFGEKVSPKLQNMLAEMGVAIGRRLPKHKSNGELNSLGRFINNVPPEIRLQRWFSNKTLAHEIGHALDNALGLQKSGFVNRHWQELLELNQERIDLAEKSGKKDYAQKDSELIAELFGVLFNDIETAYKYAPNATNEAIERMKDGDLENLLPENFDWSEAKHVLEEKVVEFFKIPVKVHPDIAATLRTVFEPKKEYLDILGFKPGKVIDEQTALMKMMEFSISGFHNIALTESYLGNVGVKQGLKEALNLKKIFNSVKNNEYDVYKNNKVAEQAIKDGLQIGTPLDIDRGTVETVINNMGKWAEEHIPGIGKPFSITTKVAEKGIELNNKVLWDVIHNNYKLTTYEILVNQEFERKGYLTDKDRKEIALWVNDSFGGLVMQALGFTPSGKKAMSRWLMSPDWFISTLRQFMGIFSSTKGHKKLNQLAANSEAWEKVKEISQAVGIYSITDDVTASGLRGRIARKFWIRSAIISALYMNMLNAMFRLWDKEKYPEYYPEKLTARDYSMLGNATGSKLYVFIGRNRDGSERYLRLGKQFREVPELIKDPIKHFGAKVAPVWQSGVTMLTGHSVGGFENKELSKAEGWERVGLAAKNMASKYVPLSVQNAYSKEVLGYGSDFTAFDFIGNSSKGMNKYKAKEQFIKAFEKGGKASQIQDIEKSMRMNNISAKDINTVKNNAKTAFLKPYKEQYKEALTTGNTKKIENISKAMTKKNVSTIDQRKIYSKALSEFYKERGISQ